MHSSSLIAVILCMAAQGSYALCADPAAAQSPHTVAELKSPSATSTPLAAGAPPAPGLIKTATAGVRDGLPSRETPTASQGQREHPHRGGTAMLLAALALMSGIALRRYGAPGS